MAENDNVAQVHTSETCGPVGVAKPPCRMGGGSTKASPVSQGGSGCGINTRQRGNGRRLKDWQESKTLVPCATPDNPNDVPDPGSPVGGKGGSYDAPL